MTIEGANKGRAVFGPVPSRRLGMSLGVDLVVPKTCTLDCVYCECGRTTHHTTQRAPYRPAGEVLAQVEARLAELAAPPDFVTLAGWGEPTLNSDLGAIVAGLRGLGDFRLAILTNSTLCPDPEVRAVLAGLDVVVPSLDAVSREAFERINRPAPGLETEAVIAGLTSLRREMSGEMWLEILLAEGVNDSPEELALLRRAVEEINPHRVQLNTVVRPPAVEGIGRVDDRRLAEIAAGFGPVAEVIAPPSARATAERGRVADEVVEMTRRRPCTLDDLAKMTGLGREKAAALVDELVGRGRLTVENFADRVYYRGS
jgi:wyosine [tRNA(Phe)-imidazoG37] synthetase (radical SAM superfamily)